MPSLTRDEFRACLASAHERHPSATLAVPISVRLLSDMLTPVVAYRRLVAQDPRTATSFLLESVENGDRQGRYSIMGAQPSIEVIARDHDVQTIRREGAPSVVAAHEPDPLLVPRRLSSSLHLVRPPERTHARLPDAPLAGWFGYAGYDTVRYAYPHKLPRTAAPTDDRSLPDLHFSFYPTVVVFDHAERLLHVIRLAIVEPDADPDRAYDVAVEALDRAVLRLQTPDPAQAISFKPGRLDAQPPAAAPLSSNLTRERHSEMVDCAKEYIRSGDIFQVVLGQRFERQSHADPFDVYRALRAVNPSPYMVYMQCEGVILVASSPEILCRVRTDRASGERIVTNRPLAGTRRRGPTPAEDAALEAELLADEKERSEHIMLVDLGRNDVGQVAIPGSVNLPTVMAVERYSHVMHISSTVTGELRPDVDAWDALRAALPVGTVSGAPKVRAMQIIDELEPCLRGPYGGGMGYASLEGDMDIALALRTIVVPTALRSTDGEWTYHLQASGGIVADSRADAEYDETVNKAAALNRAVALAESAFTQSA